MASSAFRPKRTVTAAEKEMFLSLTPDDITLSLMHSLFTDTMDRKTGKVALSQFNTYDEIPLKAGEYFNKEDIVTNCGLFIFNKFLLERDWKDSIGYVNVSLNKKGYKKLENRFAYLILTDETGTIVEKFMDYLDRLCWLLFTYHSEICASMTMKVCKPLPRVKAEKERLLKKYEKEIANKDIPTVVKIQEELVRIAKEELKDDPSMELYDSGARGAFDNAYRQDQIIKGPVFNASRGEWDIVTASLNEGMERKNLPTLANAIVSGSYPKSIGTGISGYQTKKINAMLQSSTLEEDGTDCGTSLYDEVLIEPNTINFYLYHNIIEKNGYVPLTPENQSKYMGKVVKMRLPGNCTHDPSTCSVCAGRRFYMMGMTKIGLTSGRISNSLLRAKMKKSHDATVRLHKLDTERLFV